MAVTIDIDSSSAAAQLVPVYIQAGGSGTNVAVVNGDTVNVFNAVDSNATPFTTIANGSNQTFTTNPIWIASNSVSTVTFTGPGY